MDDLQWADPASLRWLGGLAGRLPGLRVTVVVSVREGEPGADAPPVQALIERASCCLWLAPLSVKAVAALVADHLGRPGRPAQIAAHHEASGGNPSSSPRPWPTSPRTGRGPGMPRNPGTSPCASASPSPCAPSPNRYAASPGHWRSSTRKPDSNWPAASRNWTPRAARRPPAACAASAC
ncbi:hypothetical protein ACFQ2B_00535 [Streptomyces stramineus]